MGCEPTRVTTPRGKPARPRWISGSAACRWCRAACPALRIAADPGAPTRGRGAGTRGSLRARPPRHLRPPGGATTRGAARSEDGGDGFASPGRPPGRGRTGRAAILAVVLSAAGRARHDSQAEQGGGGRRRREPPRTSGRGRRSSSRPSAAASPSAGAARPARGGGSGGRQRGAGQSRSSGTGTAARRCGAVPRGGRWVRGPGRQAGLASGRPAPRRPRARSRVATGGQGRAPSAWGAGMGAGRGAPRCRAGWLRAGAPTGVCERGARPSSRGDEGIAAAGSGSPSAAAARLEPREIGRLRQPRARRAPRCIPAAPLGRSPACPLQGRAPRRGLPSLP